MRRNGKQWAIMNKLDSKIERERERERERETHTHTEFLFNMLNSLFSLINVKAKLNMTSSESIGSPCFAAICYFIMNKIQQNQPATRTPFVSLFDFNSTTTPWCHLLSTTHLIIPTNQFEGLRLICELFLEFAIRAN